MKGLELARAYFEECGFELISEAFPSYAGRIAFGLCGEGSECLGFDDEFSRDHDFGAAFCMWLTDEDYDSIGEELNEAYRTLPQTFMGFNRKDIMSNNGQRVGAMRTSDFYRKFTGLSRAPQTLEEWRRIPEHFLSIVTSGEVFKDNLGEFSKIRNNLLEYYPEDIRLKKLIARVAVMAQAGQYNYGRCMKRKEYVAATCALAEFMRAAMSGVYLINKKYMPFYKWAHRGMLELPLLTDVYYWLEAISIIPEYANAESAGIGGHISLGSESYFENIETEIEEICISVRDLLVEQKLTDSDDSFLLAHCESMMQRIENSDLRRMSIFAE